MRENGRRPSIDQAKAKTKDEATKNEVKGVKGRILLPRRELTKN